VADLIGVETHVLRFWETEFPQAKPQRAVSNQRLYTRKNVETFLRIKHLLHNELYTIAGAKKKLDAAPSSTESGRALAEIKKGLLEIKTILG
jgi:DNA-binding transcriptional MerR regulator